MVRSLRPGTSTPSWPRTRSRRDRPLHPKRAHATTFTAGYTHTFPYRKFLAADILAGFIWGTYAGLLGYFGGVTFKEQPWKGFLFTFGLAVGVAAVIELVRHRRAKRSDSVAEVPGPEPDVDA